MRLQFCQCWENGKVKTSHPLHWVYCYHLWQIDWKPICPTMMGGAHLTKAFISASLRLCEKNMCSFGCETLVLPMMGGAHLTKAFTTASLRLCEKKYVLFGCETSVLPMFGERQGWNLAPIVLSVLLSKLVNSKKPNIFNNNSRGTSYKGFYLSVFAPLREKICALRVRDFSLADAGRTAMLKLHILYV